MSYATSSPAATTGGQGNTPVSPFFFLLLILRSAYLPRGGGWSLSAFFFLLSAEGQAWRWLPGFFAVVFFPYRSRP